jgi:hypothetical protein
MNYKSNEASLAFCRASHVDVFLLGNTRHLRLYDEAL